MFTLGPVRASSVSRMQLAAADMLSWRVFHDPRSHWEAQARKDERSGMNASPTNATATARAFVIGVKSRVLSVCLTPDCKRVTTFREHARHLSTTSRSFGVDSRISRFYCYICSRVGRTAFAKPRGGDILGSKKVNAAFTSTILDRRYPNYLQAAAAAAAGCRLRT